MAFDTLQPEYLFRLARSGSPVDRKHLAQSVMGFMRSNLEASERAIAEDILLQLLKEAETEIRLALAEQLAHVPECPKSLVDFLIYENTHDVADAMLQYSDVLSDDDLIDIVQHFNDTRYWQSIARRKAVSENVTRYLIGTDDHDVYRILVKNRGAEFCPISLEWMVSIAANVPEIQAPLLQRPEVTPELASKLYWHVSAELRSVITSRFDINIKQIDALLNKLVKHRLATREQDKGITAEDYAQSRRVKHESGITSHQLLEALQKDKTGLFYCLWADLLDLDPEMVRAKMKENPTETLAVLCRLARITVRHYNVFFLLWRRHDRQARSGMNLGNALAFYEALDLGQARSIMDGWTGAKQAAQTVTTIH